MPKSERKTHIDGKTRADKNGTRWGNQFDKQFDDVFLHKLADEMLEWFESDEIVEKEIGEKKVKVNVPRIWFKDFFIQKRIPIQRLSEFRTQNDYFANMYELCLAIQESKLVKLGIDPRYKPTMPIFALKNQHGWKDQQDINIGKADGVVFISSEKKEEDAG